MAKTMKVNLNKDKTVTGDVTGKWSMTNGTYYMKIVINGVTYNGIFFKQHDESKNDLKVMTFSAIGSNNECIWGSKK
jgi:arabinan endo-1,5-alpha-L-arabinosidase